MNEVKVMPQVSQALGEMPLSRESLIAALTQLYDQLENHADRYKNRRDPEDENLFDYVLWLYDGSQWHTLRFSIDDTQAQGFFSWLP